MEVGERIFVQTPFFEGEGEIMHIARGELYPLQIIMDKPDTDGHYIQRFAYSESVEPPQETAQAVAFESAQDPQLYVGEVVRELEGYRLKRGERYALGVVTYPGVFKPGPAKVYHIHDPYTLKFYGCMPVDCFQVSGLYDPSDWEREPIEGPPVPSLAELPQVLVQETEQLSLFDL